MTQFPGGERRKKEEKKRAGQEWKKYKIVTSHGTIGVEHLFLSHSCAALSSEDTFLRGKCTAPCVPSSMACAYMPCVAKRQYVFFCCLPNNYYPFLKNILSCQHSQRARCPRSLAPRGSAALVCRIVSCAEKGASTVEREDLSAVLMLHPYHAPAALAAKSQSTQGWDLQIHIHARAYLYIYC